jgi:hypothetical protein
MVVDYYEQVSLTLDNTVGYATYYGDKALTIPSDVTVYTGKIDGGQLVLSEVTGVLPAQTAVIVNGTPGATATFRTTTEEAAAITDNDLQGVTTDTEKENVYVLSYRTGLDDLGFYHTASHTIPANRVYVEWPAQNDAASAPVLRFNFGTADEMGNVSGLDAITTEDNNDAIIYDLRGRRVEEMSRPGLYIVGGKKVSIR